jgi:phosphate transport system substrate-binding protein
MYKQPADPAASAEAMKFFDWAYKNGKKAAEALDYVPLPDSVIAQIEKTWAEIKGPDGKPVYAP